MNFGNIPVKERMNSSFQHSRKLRRIGFSFFKLTLFCFLIFLVVGVVSIYGMFRGIIDSAPDISSINMEPTGYTTKIYDASNHVTASLEQQEQNRETVSFADIPEHLIEAFILTEDPNFFYHKGNDARQFLYQFSYDFFNNTTSDTFGTITQQLIRNTVFNGGVQKSFGEKLEQIIQEGYLSIQLEKQMDKTEILELYLNGINLGSNTLGIQSAAMHYFNKNVSELTLSECSVLAATASNPSRYNPFRQQQSNAEQRLRILSQMLTAQLISNEEYQEAVSDNVYARLQTPSYNTENDTSILSYYNEEVINSVLADLQNELGYSETQAYNLVYYGGLSIYTPMNAEVQATVDKELNSSANYPEENFSLSYTLVVSHSNETTETYTEANIKDYYQTVLNQSDFQNIFSNEAEMMQAIDSFKHSTLHKQDTILDETIKMIPQPQASMVVLDQRNGHVLALSGGRGERSNNLSLNRASDSLRQPGSIFSVLSTFAPALDICGATLASTYYDSPLHTSEQSFTDSWNETYMGYTNIHQAIEFSMNVVAARCLSESVTPSTSYDYLSQFHFSSLAPEDKSITLATGNLTNGVTNLEMTAAYAAIANGGVYTEPVFYTTVMDRNGKIILEKEHSTSIVMKNTTASLLTHALEDSVSGENYWENYDMEPTGTQCQVDGMSIAGKSGVSLSTGDYWFIGYSPYMTCGIWSGYDDSSAITTYNGYYKKIWQKVMEQTHKDFSDPEFLYSENLESAQICSKSGLLAIEDPCNHGTSNSVVYTEWFEKGTVPTQYCNRHTKVNICTQSNMQAGKNCPVDKIKEMVYLIIDGKDLNETPTEDSKHALPDDLLKSTCTVHNSVEETS